MKKIVIFGLSLVLCLGVVAVTVMAQGPGNGRGFDGPGYSPLADLLANLTPEQSAKVRSLRQAHLQETAPLQQELLKKGIDLRNLSLDANAAPAAIASKQKEIWDLRSELRQITNNFRQQIRELLTPEQQAQFDSFGPRRGMGPRMGRGPSQGSGSGLGPGNNQ
jgi:Spy/CpxP family protein refolding chaperone